MMLLILTVSVSNRLLYISDLMLKEMLGLDVRVTTSREEFTNYSGPKLTYAKEPLADGLFIEASGLLFETAICLYELKSSTIDGVPVLFETAGLLSVMAFDPFSAAFYVVSRYEEYHPHKKDSFGRYPVTESIAWREKFLDIPVVHLWADMLKRLLTKYYPDLKFHPLEYHFVPTIDIDHAWCYLGRTISRTMGGFGRSVMHGRMEEISHRFKVLAGMAPDPYDNYAYINEVHVPYANLPIFFVLFADYGLSDNNVTVTSKKFHLLLRELDKHGRVGIHPSLSSNRNLSKLENEYSGLCEVLNRDVALSRQHFLKLTMPETYRSLLQLGITDDYSMGYASQTGFRAGISIPFLFFDLGKDVATTLRIHPVTLMDVTMKDYLRLSRVESLEKIAAMIQTIRAVNGEFVSLWHNESLGDTGRWTGWREVYEEMVKMASA